MSCSLLFCFLIACHKSDDRTKKTMQNLQGEKKKVFEIASTSGGYLGETSYIGALFLLRSLFEIDTGILSCVSDEEPFY